MNTNFLDSLTNFLKKRTFELLGLILVLSSVALAIAFTTYSPEDPSFIYGDRSFEIQNFFGIYGSSVADFLLQSFGLASFLLLLNFLFWGLDLIIKKELRRIILKLFLVVAYLTVGTVFIYLTFDNSFWLIDNGNSGFVGKITYNFINTWAPWIDNTYSIYGLLLLTIIFFSFSADINYKKVFSVILSLFKRKPAENIEPDFSKITPEVMLEALGQAFFTLSLGMGAIMAYGAYMPASQNIGKTAISVAALDTGVALLAGIAIFPIVFANGLAASEGPGLVFVTLPIAFSSMPLGVFFGTLFFVLLSIAALSSSISLIEPGVAWLIESLKIKRFTATLLLGFIAWFLGLFSALSFNLLSEFTIFGKNFFDATDFLTNQIMLPLGGIFIAIFVGWVMKKENVLEELDIEENLIFKFWYFSIRYISPVMVGCVFLYFFI